MLDVSLTSSALTLFQVPILWSDACSNNKLVDGCFSSFKDFHKICPRKDSLEIRVKVELEEKYL